MLLLFDNQPHQAGKLGGLEHGDDSALELGAFNRHDKPGQFAGAQVDSLKRRFKKAGADKLVIVKDGVFQLALGKRSGIEIAVTHYNALHFGFIKIYKAQVAVRNRYVVHPAFAQVRADGLTAFYFTAGEIAPVQTGVRKITGGKRTVVKGRPF